MVKKSALVGHGEAKSISAQFTELLFQFLLKFFSDLDLFLLGNSLFLCAALVAEEVTLELFMEDFGLLFYPGIVGGKLP